MFAERGSNSTTCAIRLGLIQGAVAELRAPLEAQSLVPFVAPSLGVARLRATRAVQRD
ncbi:MAG TPA: hypothetical protein VIL87_10125 [Dermatophilaceae bacterium]|jgi:hypothetical protein